VEEEHQLGLVRVADLRQPLEQLGQHPQQEGRIKARRVEQLVRGEDVDDAASFFVGLQEVVDVEHGLAEEFFAALRLDLQQAALDDADAGCCVRKSPALSPTYCSMARRSFRSRSSRPLSSAILNTRFSTPACVSFSASMRPSSSGPMSDTVARTGWPCSPNTSHSVVGAAKDSRAGSLRSLIAASSLPPSLPGWLMPVRSPLMSARKTGTPICENFSAIACSVTVLPVPVAPVISPCRLASPGSRKHSVLSFFATSRGSAMVANVESGSFNIATHADKRTIRGWTQQMGQ